MHAGISPDDVRRQVAAHPDAELLVHPECGCATSALWLAGEGELPAGRTHILSTGGMVDAARTTTAAHRAGRDRDRHAAPAAQGQRPDTTFLPMNPKASCRFMKMTTPELLLRCLREGRDEVRVAPDVAARARRAVERMIALGAPGGGE